MASPGDIVLASSATGGVGNVAVQLARLAGATVIGTSSPDNFDYLQSIGVIPVSYRPGLTGRVSAAAPGGITAALKYHDSAVIETALELGVPKDCINTVIGNADRYGISGVGNAGHPKDLETVAALVAGGKLTLPVESYALDQVVEAYERLDSGRVRGKLVIRF